MKRFSGVNCVQAPTEDKVHGKPGCAPSIETFTPCWPTGVHHLRKRGGKSVKRIGKRGNNYDPLPKKKRHAIKKIQLIDNAYFKGSHLVSNIFLFAFLFALASFALPFYITCMYSCHRMTSGLGALQPVNPDSIPRDQMHRSQQANEGQGRQLMFRFRPGIFR